VFNVPFFPPRQAARRLFYYCRAGRVGIEERLRFFLFDGVRDEARQRRLAIRADDSAMQKMCGLSNCGEHT